MTPLVVPAIADLPIRFVPFTGTQPDFIFDGSSAETASHRYEVRTSYEEDEEDEDGEEVESGTLVRTDKASGDERAVFSPPASFELGVTVLGNELVLKCGGMLFFVESDKQLVEIQKWCVEGDSEEPLDGCIPVDHEVVAHPRVPLLVVSSSSHHPVGSWLVVRREGKNHLVGAVETINCGTSDRELIFGAGSELMVIENVDQLVARASDAPVIAHPLDELLAELQNKFL